MGQKERVNRNLNWLPTSRKDVAHHTEVVFFGEGRLGFRGRAHYCNWRSALSERTSSEHVSG
jgi:hypothetical protein